MVIGTPRVRDDDGIVSATGTAARIALAAAGAGRRVQLVGKIGDDPLADALVIDLARGGVGHVAVLRDAGRSTPIQRSDLDDEAPGGADHDDATSDAVDPSVADGPVLDAADVDLGLRYLTDFQVVVLAESAPPDVISVVAEAAEWGDARMILVVGADDAVPGGLPADVVVFAAPSSDPDGVFATLVGVFAAALDDGTEPEAAFRASIATDGWTDAVAE